MEGIRSTDAYFRLQLPVSAIESRFGATSCGTVTCLHSYDGGFSVCYHHIKTDKDYTQMPVTITAGLAAGHIIFVAVIYQFSLVNSFRVSQNSGFLTQAIFLA